MTAGILAFAAVLLLCVLYIFFSSNTGQFKGKKYVYVRTGSNYEQLMQSIADSGIVSNIGSFKRMASWLNLSGHIHPGRYEVKEGMGNYTLVSMLKSGKQSVVKLVINKLRTRNDIIRKFSSLLEPDSTQWAKLFSDSVFLKRHQIDTNQLQSLVMPNTYEFYWNTSAENVMEKIAAYSDKWWNTERLEKAKALGLSRVQVTTLASIVEEETLKDDEKPTIASVYLNRYRVGMNLGADPTVKFAVGNFALKRILNIHTQFISPYNTYRVSGIPPGPICTPSAASIEAVLNPAHSNYLFFCAKEDRSGYHNFATTYSEHLDNARRYQQSLNARGIH